MRRLLSSLSVGSQTHQTHHKVDNMSKSHFRCKGMFMLCGLTLVRPDQETLQQSRNFLQTSRHPNGKSLQPYAFPVRHSLSQANLPFLVAFACWFAHAAPVVWYYWVFGGRGREEKGWTWKMRLCCFDRSLPSALSLTLPLASHAKKNSKKKEKKRHSRISYISASTVLFYRRTYFFNSSSLWKFFICDGINPRCLLVV